MLSLGSHRVVWRSEEVTRYLLSTFQLRSCFFTPFSLFLSLPSISHHLSLSFSVSLHLLSAPLQAKRRWQSKETSALSWANVLQGLFLLTLTSYSTAPLDSLQIGQALSLNNSVLPDAKSSTIHVTSLHLTSQLYHVQEHHARVSRLAATFGSNGLVLGLRLLKNFMRDTI